MSNSRSKRLLAFSRLPVVRRSVIALLGLLLLYSVFGYFLLPVIIKSQAQALISRTLHRDAALGKVEVDPFAFAVTVRDFKIMEPEGNAVFATFDALTVDLSSESILRVAPVVQEVRLTKPYLHLERRDARRYNIDDLIELFAHRPPSPQPARFSINNIQVEGGRIEFRDGPKKSSHAISDISLGVPFVSSLPSQVNVFVEPLLRAQVDGTPLLLKGKARPFAEPRDAVVELNLDGLDLTRYVEYLPFQPRFKLRSARLDTRLVASFQQPGNKAPALMLSGDAALASVRITQLDGAPMLKLPELRATLGNTDVFSGRFELAKMTVNGLEADVSRDRDGRLNLLHLLPASASGQNTAPTAKPASAAGSLHFSLAELEMRGGALRYTDQGPARPLRADVEKFDLAVRKLAVDSGKRTVSIGEVASGNARLLLQQRKPALQTPATARAAGPELQTGRAKSAAGDAGAAYALRIDRVGIENWSARLEDHRQLQPAATLIAPLSASIQDFSTASSSPARVELKATVNNTGRLALSGQLGLAPLRTDVALDLKEVDILPLQPLVADRLNLQFTRVNLSANGRLRLDAGEDGKLKGGFRGDMNLANLAAVDNASGNDFLRWKSLFLGGMDVRLEPFAVAVDNVALADFFARVIIDPGGRINLQDIARIHSSDRKSLTGTTDSSSAAAQAAPARADAPALAQASVPQAPKAGPPPISIRKLTFQGGRVRFSDNFIKPNYSANLMNFGGVVTGLSSDASATAGVDLHGEVNRAPLSIAGRINPLRRDLFLDLRANVRGMELAALSPYADRYMGYGIEKGKLSFEVAYHVENRRLSAANQLILDQLTLSEKAGSAAVTKLPVKLALALLQDRNGIVDINVPIDGTLDDPQFSIGGIILKVIGNAIAKAVTRPFALLGSLFDGGGRELSSLSFEPGRSAIPPAGEPTLDALARALLNRPALKLEITGWSDPEKDREGLKRASIERKVRALKMKDLQARGRAAEFGSVVVTADEYPVLLVRVYREEKFDKPRNLIGLPKNLPPDEMEKSIIAHTTIDDGDLQALANRRAQATRDWLLKSGQVPAERIFILAPRSDGQGAGGAASAQSKVDFSLR